MVVNRRMHYRTAAIIVVMIWVVASSRLRADTGTCGGQTITLPFTDVAAGNLFFCAIAEAYFSGLANGTTATTYSPSDPVPRQQMAAFVTRALDQSVKRSHARAALGEWWTNKSSSTRFYTNLAGANPQYLACDGPTVWASTTTSNEVSRIDIKTGEVICRLTGIPSPEKIVIVSGFVYIASFQTPGKIYFTTINRTTGGTISPMTGDVGSNPVGITYDGENLWTANAGAGPGNGSISKVAVNGGTITATTFAAGLSQPVGILFDGANLWLTDVGDASLKRVATSDGAVLQTIPLSGTVGHPVFDGTNLWIPCAGPDSVYVVRATGGLTGTVLAQLTGNGLNQPSQAAFDGERILVPNTADQTVSLWKASDLSPIASVTATSTFYNPRGVCSDGITFFIGLKTLPGGGAGSEIVRF